MKSVQFSILLDRLPRYNRPRSGLLEQESTFDRRLYPMNPQANATTDNMTMLIQTFSTCLVAHCSSGS